MKNQKGITLIALVITIIVLLILAAISMVTLIGKNGILTKAIEAKEETQIKAYHEKIELIRTELRLNKENYEPPTLQELQNEFDHNQKAWVESTSIKPIEGIEKLELITKEKYIFHITETSTEYRGKDGKVVDIEDLNNKNAISLKVVGEGENGKLVEIRYLGEKDYFKIEYQIDSEEGKWEEIESGGKVEVGYGATIHSRLTYVSNKGITVSLSVEDSDPVVTAKSINTSNITRKTEKEISELFKITWGSDGTGRIECKVTGNLEFKNTEVPSREVSNLSELELGRYLITCKVISPSKKEATATKEVKITKLANTSVIDASSTSVDAYAIYSQYDLAYYRDLVNIKTQLTINGKLMNDINLNNVCSQKIGNWEPIGSTKYSGIFDGDNHTIDYLYIDTTNDNQGLFGMIENATIRGIVIGQYSSITGNAQVAGIAGDGINSNISKCGNKANITVKTSTAGGIIGRIYNKVRISETYNIGEIKGEGNQDCIGGICGFLKDSNSPVIIENSYNTGAVTGGYYIGGILGAGNDYAKINNCYNKGTITSNGGNENVYIGGIVGRLRAYGEANYCYNLGKINNSSTSLRVGGIAGEIRARIGKEDASKIENCYNSGDIESKGIVVGGIGSNDHYCYVKNSYVADSITVKYIVNNNEIFASANIGSPNYYLGKILGHNNAGSSNVANLGILNTMPTVYHVVNSLNSGDSQIWSKINNENQPKLVWEVKVEE